jgi:hypothetical protein
MVGEGGLSQEKRFRKVYVSLPLNARTETIVVIEGKPISWNLAFQEIENITDLGKEILKKLERLEII